MAKRKLSRDEVLRRLKETQRKLEQVKVWLDVVLQERIRDGTTGRVVVEIFTDGGYAKKVRMTQEASIDDEPEDSE